MNLDQELEKYACGKKEQIHELLNAASMVGVGIINYKWIRKRRSNIVPLAVLLHVPYSVSYHSSLALGIDKKKSSALRFLDFTFIHTISVLMSYKTSNNNHAYLVINIIYNSLCVLSNIFPEYRSRKSMLKKIFISCLLYTSPLIIRRRIKRFLLCWIFLISGSIFYSFSGWAHFLTRISAIGLQWTIMTTHKRAN